jgi:hypothetical protein
MPPAATGDEKMSYISNDYTIAEVEAKLGAALQKRNSSGIEIGIWLIEMRRLSKHGDWGKLLLKYRIPTTSAGRYIARVEWLKEQNVQLDNLTEDSSVSRITSGLLDMLAEGEDMYGDEAVIAKVFKAAWARRD